MLTYFDVDIEEQKIYARVVEADAMGGDVIPGIATATEILSYADEAWAAPFECEDPKISFGDYSGFEISGTCDIGMTLDDVWDDIDDDSKHDFSTPTELDQFFDTGDGLAEFIMENELETDEGYWMLHLGNWSSGQKVCAVWHEAPRQ